MRLTRPEYLKASAKITRAMLKGFQRSVYRWRLLASRTLVISGLSVPVVLAYIKVSCYTQKTAMLIVGAMGLAYALFVLIIMMVSLSVYRSLLLKYVYDVDPVYRDEQTYTVTDDSFIVESPSLKTVHRLDGIFAVQEDGDFILVFFRPSVAYAVPKRCFAGVEEAGRFIGAVKGSSRGDTG